MFFHTILTVLTKRKLVVISVAITTSKRSEAFQWLLTYRHDTRGNTTDVDAKLIELVKYLTDKCLNYL